MRRTRPPKKVIWLKDKESGLWIFVKFNLKDTQIGVPREVLEERGKKVVARIYDFPQGKRYEEELSLYACSDTMCKCRLSRVHENSKVVVGVI